MKSSYELPQEIQDLINQSEASGHKKTNLSHQQFFNDKSNSSLEKVDILNEIDFFDNKHEHHKPTTDRSL